MNMHRVAVFAYPHALTYSGQTAATEFAMRELRQLGWTCYGITFPALDRSKAKPVQYAVYFTAILHAWWLLFVRADRSKPVLVFNHGQSMMSFLRMGVPHLALRALAPKRHIVMSLHGSVFMEWTEGSRDLRLLMRLIAASDTVTVLGEAQRAALIRLEVPDSKIRIVPNTTDLTTLSEDTIRAKHVSLEYDPTSPLVLLHLSLLIESKGYVAFLEACHALALTDLSRPLEIFLVGPMSFTSYCTRFTTPQSKRAWIEQKVSELNGLPGVTAQWIEGAHGAEKAAFYVKSHIFVFPSRFPVEAQPLVLLEAMAAGCAIIATDQGEIPSTMGDATGVCLSDTEDGELANAIGMLARAHNQRLAAGLAGARLVRVNFSPDRYGANWNDLLTSEWNI
jgi:glycosyltransferase involved in cell wall biosynthesis